MTDIRDLWLHAHSLIRTARQIVNENLRPLHLSSAEGNILLHLWLQGHEMAQDQLVAQLEVSKPAISRGLAALEAGGFVTRRPDPHDRRGQHVRLTAQAMAIGPAVEQAYNQLYALAAEGFSQGELDEFIRLLGRVAENFRHAQAGQKCGGRYV